MFVGHIMTQAEKISITISAIIALCALLALFRKDKDKQKQINLLENQLKLSAAPNLYIGDGGGMTTLTGELKIYLSNTGECATIYELRLKSGDITLTQNQVPFELDKGGQKYIVAKEQAKINQ